MSTRRQDAQAPRRCSASSGSTPGQLVDFATNHELLFYVGGWLQVTGALLSAVADDQATVARTLALSNGVFARIFPLASAPLAFAGIGFALSGGSPLPQAFGRSALAVAGLFVPAGVAAIFGTPGLTSAIQRRSK